MVPLVGAASPAGIADGSAHGFGLLKCPPENQLQIISSLNSKVSAQPVSVGIRCTKERQSTAEVK